VTIARWLFPGLLALSAGASLVAGLLGLAGWSHPGSAGALSMVLPWTGVFTYGVLAVVAGRSPSSPVVTQVLGLCLFVHACLVVESLAFGSVCAACLSVAGSALAAAAVLGAHRPAARLTLACGLLLGIAAGFFNPFDRLEDALDRHFWPSRILDRAPDFVDRGELAACNHGRSVRLLVYEDEQLCRSCSSVSRKLLPGLTQSFPADLCIHRHSVRRPPSGPRLPLFILLSAKGRMVTIEGRPGDEELRDLIRFLAAE
jgi:hypothetical protein